MRLSRRLGRSALAGFAANLALWAAALPLSPRAADDPRLREKAPSAKAEEGGTTGGMTFDLRTCFDCSPEYVLLGRELPTGPVSGIIVLVNLPPILMATGAELAYGVYELRASVLVAGVALQWLAMVAAWEALGGRRRIRPLVSVIVVVFSGIPIVGASLTAVTYGCDTETRLLVSALGIYFLLGLWAARGSRVGTLLLAAALLAAAMGILVASRNDNVPPELARDYSASHWRLPAFLSMLGGALLYDRWRARRHVAQAAQKTGGFPRPSLSNARPHE
jgi:hypothetical protein